MAEPGEELTDATAQPGTGARSRRRGWLAAAIAGIALVLVVAVFAVFALARSGAPAPGGSPLGSSSPGISPARQPATASWRLYHDPLGLFTARIPPGWKAASDSSGSYSEGSSNLSASGRLEMVTFNNPAQGKASASLQLAVEQITSDAGRRLECQNWPPDQASTTTINGYLTQNFQTGVVWMINSQTAHFQIDATIPGVMEPWHTSPLMTTIPPTPTPLPQSWVQQDRTYLADMLGSFQPTAQPLTCS